MTSQFSTADLSTNVATATAPPADPLLLSRPHSAAAGVERYKWLVRGLSLLLFAAGWELLALQINSLLMPGFSETVVALGNLLFSPRLWSALWVSNQAMVLGLALATISGVGLGLLTARQPLLARILDPYLNIMLVTPKSALIPLIILALGIGLGARVLVIFLFVFVVVVVNTQAGLRTLDPAWEEMARAFGATEWQLWRRVLWPGALPGILTGLRLALARAVTGMLAVELLLVAIGVGRLILDYQARFEPAYVYATAAVLIAEAQLLLWALRLLEERWLRWLPENYRP